VGLEVAWLYLERRLEGPHNLTIMLEQKFPFARGPRVDQAIIPVDDLRVSAKSTYLPTKTILWTKRGPFAI